MGLVNLFVIIAGLFMVSDFISLISGFVAGGGNALSEGSSLASKTKGMITKANQKVGSGARKTLGAFTRAGGYANERRKYIKDELKKREDAAAPGTFDRKAEKQNIKEELGGKRVRNHVYGGGAVGGFLRSMGHDVAHGAGGVLDTLSSKAGFGKGEDWGKAINQEGRLAGHATAKARNKKQVEGEFGEKKLIRSFAKAVDPATGGINIDKLAAVVKDLEKSGDTGKKSFEVSLAKDSTFQSLLGAMGYSSPNKVTYEQFVNNAKSLKRDKDLRESSEKARYNGHTQQEIFDGFTDASGNRVDGIKDILNKYGITYNTGDFDEKHINDLMNSYGSKSFISSSMTTSERNAHVELEALANSLKPANVQQAASQVKVIEAQRLKVLEGMDTEGNSSFGDAVLESMAASQSMIDKLDNGTALENLDSHVNDKLEQKTKEILDAAKQYAQSMSNNQKAIVEELKKNNKKS